ncbi:hypothetical protein ACA910_007785 [Epithemia clementina (nom. ined.)]
MTDTINESAPTITEDAVSDTPEHVKPEQNKNVNNKDTETATAVSEESAQGAMENAESKSASGASSGGPIVSSSKKTRPPYKFDPDKITLRFLFANRDGLTVTIECNPSDTVGEVKGSLMSVWPEGLPPCTDGEQIRLVCMGKGYLMPDSRTLGECEIPVFKTHPTPINVSMRPEVKTEEEEKTLKKKENNSGSNGRGPGRAGQSSDTAANQEQASQGCMCVLL